MKRTTVAVLLAGALLAILVVAMVQAQGPGPAPGGVPPVVQGEITASDDTINFQGRLTDLTGVPQPGGHTMVFAIVDGGGGVVWGPETHNVTADADGLFNCILGTQGGGAITADHFVADRYLRITVNGDSLGPNQQITSVAIAIGNIRKNVQDSSIASVPSDWLLWVENTAAAPTAGAGLIGIAVDAIGLRGVSTSDAGVVGWSSTGWGVLGLNTSGPGVQGQSTDSRGVYGYSTNDQGVRGYSNNYIGVVGRGLNHFGVYGYSDSTDSFTGWGVHGYATSTTADVYGVVGAASTATIWLPPSGGSAGVSGSVNTHYDFGTFGINGVTGANYGFGVVGMASTTTFIYPVNRSVGVLGSVTRSTDMAMWAANNNTAGGYGIYAKGYNAVVGETTEPILGWAGLFFGDLGCTGLKPAVVDTSQGPRPLYAVESPEVWFEDFGTATLVNGQAVVEIEGLFAETVNLGENYHIFLTPLGDCAGLYIARKTPTSFEVRELGGGTANISFDYRIIAKRLGYETTRMPQKFTVDSIEELRADVMAAPLRQAGAQDLDDVDTTLDAPSVGTSVRR